MKEKIFLLQRKIKEWITQVLFKIFLTPIILFIIYFVILGPTSIIAKLFFRKALSKSTYNQNSNWLEVKNYEGNLENSYEQS